MVVSFWFFLGFVKIVNVVVQGFRDLRQFVGKGSGIP